MSGQPPRGGDVECGQGPFGFVQGFWFEANLIFFPKEGIFNGGPGFCLYCRAPHLAAADGNRQWGARAGLAALVFTGGCEVSGPRNDGYSPGLSEG